MRDDRFAALLDRCLESPGSQHIRDFPSAELFSDSSAGKMPAAP